MAKKCTSVIFEEDVVDSMTAFMKDEDRKDFGPAVNIILRRYFKMRDLGVNSTVSKSDLQAIINRIDDDESIRYVGQTSNLLKQLITE